VYYIYDNIDVASLFNQPADPEEAAVPAWPEPLHVAVAHRHAI